MPSISSFDQLPVELIHKVLRYLEYHEIFFSFDNISKRMNDILNVYDRYQLNFQSIQMSHLYLTLHYMKPEQIISLILSNMDDTPGQFQMFLSEFSIKEFIRLEYLELIQPTNPNHLNAILCDLPSLKWLRSLSIIHCPPTSVNHQTFEYLTSFLHQSTSLRCLHLTGALNNLFEYKFMSSVEQLWFNDNVFNTTSLSTIFSTMPSLEALESSITLPIIPSQLPTVSYLTKLSMTIFINMTNSEMKNLLDKLPSLRYLKIIANGKQWFNGCFWEQALPTNLLRFQFNFCTQSIHLNEDIVFETFQTPFWLQNKHWYVMLDYQMNPLMTHLYSLPYCNNQFYYRPSLDNKRQCRSSAPLDQSYMNFVTKLTVDFSILVTETNPSISFTHSFPNVSTLILSDNSYFTSVQPLFDCLQSIVDLNQIVELKLGHFHYPDLIRLILSSMPHLHTLWIAETMFAKLEMLDFRQIRSLTICDCLTNVDRLCLMFPQLTHLSLRLSSIERMRRIIELLDPTLRNLTLKHINQSLKEQLIKWLTQYCENHREFSYELDQHMSLHIWFNDISR